MGEKDSKECIVVLVSISHSKLSNVIPRSFKGFFVQLVQSGAILVNVKLVEDMHRP